MKKVIVKSVFDTFEYVMDHYYPFGMEEFAERSEKYAIISVQDSHTGGFGVTFSENIFCQDVLTLLIDDVVKEVSGTILFNETHATQILDFVDKNRDKIDTLIVHCYAGQSRSAAVAAFIEEREFGTNNIYRAHRVNDYIYNKLTEVFKNRSQN